MFSVSFGMQNIHTQSEKKAVPVLMDFMFNIPSWSFCHRIRGWHLMVMPIIRNSVATMFSMRLFDTMLIGTLFFSAQWICFMWFFPPFSTEKKNIKMWRRWKKDGIFYIICNFGDLQIASDKNDALKYSTNVFWRRPKLQTLFAELFIVNIFYLVWPIYAETLKIVWHNSSIQFSPTKSNEIWQTKKTLSFEFYDSCFSLFFYYSLHSWKDGRHISTFEFNPVFNAMRAYDIDNRFNFVCADLLVNQ